MIILNLKAKNCMPHLLLRSTFDDFSFIEGEVTTYNTFKVDGFIHKNYYEEVPEKQYSSWKDLREFFFRIIKGKRTPLNFRFILSLPKSAFIDVIEKSDTADISPANIQGLYLNFKYDGTNLQCVTGTSLSIFSMDKSLNKSWDEYTKKYFLEHEIDFEL